MDFGELKMVFGSGLIDVNTLILIAAILLAFILGLISILIFQSTRGNKVKLQENSDKGTGLKEADAFQKEDLNKFMEFDSIEDDMIVQDGGEKYVMALHIMQIINDANGCSGIFSHSSANLFIL